MTYSQPAVASVGLTASDARARGLDVVEVVHDLAGNGRSQILKTTGAVKVVAERGGPVLGIHLVGDRVDELVIEAQIIVNLKIEPIQVANLLHAHPTQSEAIGEAHLAIAGKPLHAHS